MDVVPEMTGRSFLDLLRSSSESRLDPERDHVLMGRESHVAYRPGGVGYPARAIRTEHFLYIRNLAAERWPAGDPPHYVDIDRSPTKFWMMLSGLRAICPQVIAQPFVLTSRMPPGAVPNSSASLKITWKKTNPP